MKKTIKLSYYSDVLCFWAYAAQISLDELKIKFDTISFQDVLTKGLKVMDTTAFTLSQENELPIVVFDMNKKGNLLKIVDGQTIGTTVNL